MDAEYELQPRAARKRLLPWIGLALLSASWLPGLGYFHGASTLTWGLMVLVGTLLLGNVPTIRAAGGLTTALAVLLAAPMIWIAPWPYKLAPVLVVLGAVVASLDAPSQFLSEFGRALLAAGLVLLAQSVGMLTYESWTSHSHELPLPVARMVGGIAHLAGVDSTVSPTTPAGGYGVDLVLRTMRKAHHLGATWELLVDPVTWSFLVGAGLLLVFAGRWRALGVLLACAVAWIPIRTALLMALILHRALRTDFDAPLRVMDTFHSVWVLLGLVGVLALVSWRFVGITGVNGVAERHGQTSLPMPPMLRRILRPTLFAVAVAALTVAVTYDPVGIRKGGKVVVDEFHSAWEPTTRPYDNQWYGHESGYNYAAIYDYSSRFYDMARLMGPGHLDRSPPRQRVNVPAEVTTAAATTRPAIDDAVLAGCDVFVLKCATQRLSIDEVERLRRWVADGGGLLLVGEHTDVFGIGTNLNDVARQFGFQFRYDITFNIDEDKPFDYRYEPPLVPHPIVQRMPALDFEGPCTIEPLGRGGRAVMTAVGQRGEIAHYHASNFMPPPEDRADARYGAWTLLWSTKYGKGRVVAHADSTQWSNFSAFEPGKPDVWIGMLEWLNHRNGPIANPRLPYAIFAGILLVSMLVVCRFLPAAAPSPGGTLLTICAGMCAFALTAMLVRGIHSRSMPLPERKPDRPMVMVGIDRTVSDAVLSKGGFIGGKPEGFGIFERWILRLGWFIRRGEGSELFKGNDLVVFFAPSKDVTGPFKKQLVDYVSAGGRVLIIDSPEIPKSTANSLLKPFGMELRRPYTAEIQGDVISTIGLPKVPTGPSYEVVGGDKVLATVAGKPVAATTRLGKGSVTAIGFGSRFNDSNFGVTGDVVPGEELSKLYELQYGLLKEIVGR